jgi:hypothetical protein
VLDDQLLGEMRLRLHDGTMFGGAAAVVEIARSISFYYSTMVNCDTWLMNGENVAVRPNRSVAVTV